jgi:hypothetical protein
MKKAVIALVGIVLILIVIVSAQGNEGLIQIKDIEIRGDSIDLTYVFDTTGFTGNSVDVEILVSNHTSQVKRVVDTLPLDKEGILEKNVLIELPKKLSGEHFIHMRIPGNFKNIVSHKIMLGKAIGTGNVVLAENAGGKFTVYVIFIIVVIGVIVFISRSFILKSRRTGKGPGEAGNSRHGWLFGETEK